MLFFSPPWVYLWRQIGGEIYGLYGLYYDLFAFLLCFGCYIHICCTNTLICTFSSLVFTLICWFSLWKMTKWKLVLSCYWHLDRITSGKCTYCDFAGIIKFNQNIPSKPRFCLHQIGGDCWTLKLWWFQIQEDCLKLGWCLWGLGSG